MRTGVYALSPAEDAAVVEGLQQADRGQFADDAQSARYGNARGYDRPLHAARRKRPRRNCTTSLLNPPKPRRVAASLEETIGVIANHPFGTRKTGRPLLLVKIVPRYPYKIFYRVGSKRDRPYPARVKTALDRLAKTPCRMREGIAASKGIDDETKGRARNGARLHLAGLRRSYSAAIARRARRDSEGRSGQGPSPWSTPCEVLRKLLLRVRSSHRLPRAPAAAHASRR